MVYSVDCCLIKRFTWFLCKPWCRIHANLFYSYFCSMSYHLHIQCGCLIFKFVFFKFFLLQFFWHFSLFILGALCILTSICIPGQAFVWTKTIKNAPKLIFLHEPYISPCMHDEKNMFWIILERFLLFLTMQTHAQACIGWLNYTTGV